MSHAIMNKLLDKQLESEKAIRKEAARLKEIEDEIQYLMKKAEDEKMENKVIDIAEVNQVSEVTPVIDIAEVNQVSGAVSINDVAPEAIEVAATENEVPVDEYDPNNIIISDVIFDRVRKANVNNISLSDIMVAGLNHFCVQTPEDQISFVRIYAGDKEYAKNLVNLYTENGKFTEAKFLLGILEKLK